MSNDDPEQMTALFGPLYKYADHQCGDMIRFNLRGKPVEGEITWITGPTNLPSGRHAPVTYICYVTDEVTPTLVYQTEVLE